MLSARSRAHPNVQAKIPCVVLFAADKMAWNHSDIITLASIIVAVLYTAVVTLWPHKLVKLVSQFKS